MKMLLQRLLNFFRLHRPISERGQWIIDASHILQAAPFRWSQQEADSYAAALARDCFEEGFDPDDAIQTDREYWD